MKAIDLKKSILQYAIEGKLVSQDETDEPAAKLLDSIKKEKEKLIKNGDLKAGKPLPPITEEEIPFEIPKSWQWVRLGEVVSFNLGKTPNRTSMEYWTPSAYNWVSIADMIDKKTIFYTKEKVSQIALEKQFKNTLVAVGTLLMSFKLTIGRVSILGCEALHNEAIISIYPVVDEYSIFKNFLFNFLGELVSFVDTTGAIKGNTLNSQKISNMLFPLPPLAEQQRIVEKLDELLSLCDTLEKE